MKSPEAIKLELDKIDARRIILGSQHRDPIAYAMSQGVDETLASIVAWEELGYSRHKKRRLSWLKW